MNLQIGHDSPEEINARNRAIMDYAVQQIQDKMKANQPVKKDFKRDHPLAFIISCIIIALIWVFMKGR